MTDPWMVQNSGQQINSAENASGRQELEENTCHAPLQFEDNFAPTTVASAASAVQLQGNQVHTALPTKRAEENSSTGHEPLPDSDSYLRGLERKLQKIKKGSNLVEALAEKRNDCLRALLQSGDPDNNNAVLALEQPLNNPEFFRHLQPVQAISVGELVHIVNYDQLEQQEPKSPEPQEQQSEEEDSKKSLATKNDVEKGK